MEHAEPAITLNKYRCRLYYDKNREAVIKRVRANLVRKRLAAGLPIYDGPGRPRKGRPSKEAVIEAELKRKAAEGAEL